MRIENNNYGTSFQAYFKNDAMGNFKKLFAETPKTKESLDKVNAFKNLPDHEIEILSIDKACCNVFNNTTKKGLDIFGDINLIGIINALLTNFVFNKTFNSTKNNVEFFKSNNFTDQLFDTLTKK